MLLVLTLFTLLSHYYEVAGLLYPYGPTNGDSEGPSLGEVTYLHVNKRFRAYGRRYKNLYICANGYVSLGKPYCEKNPSSLSNGHSLIAPFWVAQDTTPRGGSGAMVWYRTTTDATTLSQIAADLDGEFDGCKPADFQPREAQIITWDEVPEVDECESRAENRSRCNCLVNPPDYLEARMMPRYCDCMEEDGRTEYCRCKALGQPDPQLCLEQTKQPKEHYNAKRVPSAMTNTYQLVIISDKTNTFVFFQYDHIYWIRSKVLSTDDELPVLDQAFAGFVSKNIPIPVPGSNDPYELTTTSNVGVNGRHVYKINGEDINDPECQLAASSSELMYPFGPQNGDSAGPALGNAHLVFDGGIMYYNTMYNDIWASSFGRVAFASESPNVLSGATTPGINAFFSRQDLRNEYQSDDIYSDYNYNENPDVMLSSNFWYRVTSDPGTLARAAGDLRRDFGVGADFQPTSVAVVTWLNSKSIDECARHGFTPEFCKCYFTFPSDSLCSCLLDMFLSHPDYYYEFYEYYYYTEECDDVNRTVAETMDFFLQSGPYTEENTYQAVLVTDSVATYLMLHYSDINWYKNHYFYYKFVNGPRYPNIGYAKVSFDNGTTDSTYTHSYSESDQLLTLPTSSNVNVSGRFVYKVSD